MKNYKKRLFCLALVGIMSAIAWLLSIFPKFNVFPIAYWMDVDLSDAPALLVSVVAGPWWGLLVITIKSLLHLSVSTTAVVGLAANVICGGSFAVMTGYLYRFFSKKTKLFPALVLSALLAMIPQIALSVAANYFVLLPMYGKLYGIDFMGIFPSDAYMVLIVSAHNAIKNALAGLVFTIATAAILNTRAARYIKH